MASDYAIKKDMHRMQMEQLDRAHNKELMQKKDGHRRNMQELRARHTNQKLELQNNQKQHLETLKQRNDTFVQRERLNHQDKMAKQQLQAQKDYQRAASERARNTARMKMEAQTEKDYYSNVRDQARLSTMRAKSKTEHQLSEMDKESRFRLKQKQAQHTEREKTLQTAHNNEVQRIEQQGQEALRDRHHAYLIKREAQRQSHEGELNQAEENFVELKKRQHRDYHGKLNEDEQYFKGRLQDQRIDYMDRYEENEKFNRATFEYQENRLQEELFKIKDQFAAKAEFYESRKEDPFYSLVNFNAKLVEGPGFYEVSARVPEHEMKNVRVRIQPEKISIHMAREHNQEYKGDNQTMGSNVSQTIRQDFDLEKPADHEKAVKNYKNGLLTVTVPKKGYSLFRS